MVGVCRARSAGPRTGGPEWLRTRDGSRCHARPAVPSDANREVTRGGGGGGARGCRKGLCTESRQFSGLLFKKRAQFRNTMFSQNSPATPRCSGEPRYTLLFSPLLTRFYQLRVPLSHDSPKFLCHMLPKKLPDARMFLVDFLKKNVPPDALVHGDSDSAPLQRRGTQVYLF